MKRVKEGEATKTTSVLILSSRNHIILFFVIIPSHASPSILSQQLFSIAIIRIRIKHFFRWRPKEKNSRQMFSRTAAEVQGLLTEEKDQREREDNQG